MPQLLRRTAFVAIALVGFTACHRAADDVQPITVLGEWRLVASGGGITGIMTPTPAGQDRRVVFGPDSAYAEYSNGQPVRTSTFQFRSQPSPSSGRDELRLIIKTDNTLPGQPAYYPYHVTLLTADKLNFTTGTGCAQNVEYVRTKAVASPSAAH